MPYRHFLFDLDGTIIDSDLMLVSSFYELYREYKPNERPSLKKILSFSGAPLLLTAQREFPEYDSSFIRKQYRERSYKYYDTGICLMPHVLDFLKAIKEKGYKAGIVTTKARSSTLKTLEMFKMGEYFDVLICGDDEVAPKPSPEGLLLAMEKMGANKDDTLYIGDSMYDEMASKDAGLDMALYEGAPRMYLEGYEPRLRFSDYTELIDELL